MNNGAESTPAGDILNVQLAKQVKTKVIKRIKKQAGGPDKEIWDVRVGSALLTVYFTPSGERKLFTVSYMVNGKRKRQVKSSPDLAIEEAKSVGRQLARGDFGTVELSAADRVSADRALTILKPLGCRWNCALPSMLMPGRGWARFHSRRRWIPISNGIQPILCRKGSRRSWKKCSNSRRVMA